MDAGGNPGTAGAHQPGICQGTIIFYWILYLNDFFTGVYIMQNTMKWKKGMEKGENCITNGWKGIKKLFGLYTLKQVNNCR